MTLILPIRQHVECINFTVTSETQFTTAAATANADDTVVRMIRDHHRITAGDLRLPLTSLAGLSHARQHIVWYQAGISAAPSLHKNFGNRGRIVRTCTPYEHFVHVDAR